MLFGRMYPARLRAPERSGALLFWPERYGRGRVVDRPFAEPIELPKGKKLITLRAAAHYVTKRSTTPKNR
jgi:hypothetical protein